MLPIKETNSSEESECDDLDPNTSMEVEAAIVVLFPSMIVFFIVFCDSSLAKVTSQPRINCYVRASLGVPSQLKKQTNLIQLGFYGKLYLDTFLKAHTSVLNACLVFSYLVSLALYRK